MRDVPRVGAAIGGRGRTVTAASRRKGAQAERELLGLLVDQLGAPMVRRRRASDQAADGGLDLEVGPIGAPTVHVEAKRQEVAQLASWLAQAAEGAADGAPTAVAWRRSREGWCVVMTLSDWCELVREGLSLSVPVDGG